MIKCKAFLLVHNRAYMNPLKTPIAKLAFQTTSYLLQHKVNPWLRDPK